MNEKINYNSMNTNELKIPQTAVHIHDYVDLQIENNQDDIIKDPRKLYPNYKYTLYYGVEYFGTEITKWDIAEVEIVYDNQNEYCIQSLKIQAKTLQNLRFGEFSINEKKYTYLKYHAHILQSIANEYIRKHATSEFQKAEIHQWIRTTTVYLLKKDEEIYTFSLQKEFNEEKPQQHVIRITEEYKFHKTILQVDFILQLSYILASLTINTAYSPEPSSNGLDLTQSSKTMYQHLQHLIALEVFGHGNLYKIINIENIQYDKLFDVIDFCFLELNDNDVETLLNEDAQFTIPVLLTGKVDTHNIAKSEIIVPFRIIFYKMNVNATSTIYASENDYYNQYRPDFSI